MFDALGDEMTPLDFDHAEPPPLRAWRAAPADVGGDEDDRHVVERAAAHGEDEERHMTVGEQMLVVARDEPEKAARFFDAVLLAGALLGVCLPLPVGAFFRSAAWAGCRPCVRPLHIWLIVHCVLNIVQSPLRFSLLFQLRRRSVTETILEVIQRLTRSWEWRLCSVFSMATYAWFIVGVVWLINANSCTSCPGLYRLTVGVAIVAVLKPFVTLMMFQYLFGATVRHGTEQHRQQSARPRGASTATIDRLPLEEHVKEPGCQDCEACAVCLSEFESGDLVRRLPCGHKFHRPCIDKWLRLNRACPLCVRNVELPPPAAAPAATTVANSF